MWLCRLWLCSRLGAMRFSRFFKTWLGDSYWMFVPVVHFAGILRFAQDDNLGGFIDSTLTPVSPASAWDTNTTSIFTIKEAHNLITFPQFKSENYE